MVIKLTLLATLLLVSLCQLGTRTAEQIEMDVEPTENIETIADYNQVEDIERMMLLQVEGAAMQAFSHAYPTEEMGMLTNVKKQLVAGMLYILTYENDKKDVYEAQVHIQMWNKQNHVQSVTIRKNPHVKP